MLSRNATVSTGTGDASFAGTVNATTAGGQDLVVNATGTTAFAAAVGGSYVLASLSTDAGGTTTLNGGSVKTSGTQTYADAMILGDDTTLTGTTITTKGTVAGNGHTLTLDGDATLGDAAEDIVTGLSALTVAGDAVVNASRVAATGLQTWKKTVTLGTDATFENGVLSFEGSVVGAGHDLTLTGTAVVLGDAPADGITGVDDLVVTGATDLNANTVTTTGTQTYNGGVTATNATAIALTGKGIDFKQAFSRGEPGIVPPVTITAGTAGVTFGGDVGTQGRPFAATDVRSQGGVSLAGTLWSNAAVTIASSEAAITGAPANAIRTP